MEGPWNINSHADTVLEITIVDIIPISIAARQNGLFFRLLLGKLLYSSTSTHQYCVPGFDGGAVWYKENELSIACLAEDIFFKVYEERYS